MIKHILLIDDDELFREGLARLIDSFGEFKVKSSYTTVEAALVIANKKIKDLYDLVILAPPVPESDGLKYCCENLKFFSKSPIMFLTNSYSKLTVMNAIEMGAYAFYTKGISPKDFKEVLLEITSVSNFSDIKLHPSVREILLKDDLFSLPFTIAEQEVLHLVCAQKSSAEISDDLGISVRTVESRKRNMMRKSHSKNMIGVVMQFMRSSNFRNGGQPIPGE